MTDKFQLVPLTEDEKAMRDHVALNCFSTAFAQGNMRNPAATPGVDPLDALAQHWSGAAHIALIAATAFVRTRAAFLTGEE